jgi:hypothetical protein
MKSTRSSGAIGSISLVTFVELNPLGVRRLRKHWPSGSYSMPLAPDGSRLVFRLQQSLYGRPLLLLFERKPPSKSSPSRRRRSKKSNG